MINVLLFSANTVIFQLFEWQKQVFEEKNGKKVAIGWVYG